MNGQSYVNSTGSKSLNGTTPTTPSNSYPGSVSSRDGSPSRVGDKSMVGGSQVAYKYNSDVNYGGSSVYANQQNKVVGGLAGQPYKVAARTDPEEPLYSNVGPHLLADPASSAYYAGGGGGGGGGGVYYNNSESLDNNLKSPYQPYPSPKPPRDHQPPLSSGPPRTNVLGIIPYSNEGTMSVARGSTTGQSQGSGVPGVTGVSATLQHPGVAGVPATLQHPGSAGLASSIMHAPPSNVGVPPATLHHPPSNTAMPSAASQYHPPPAASIGLPSPSLHQPSSNPGLPPSAAHSGPYQLSYQPSQTSSYYNYQTPVQPGYPRTTSTAHVPPLSRPPLSGVGPYQQVSNMGYGQQYGGDGDLGHMMSNMSVSNSGFNHLWGRDSIDLLKTKDILPTCRVEPPPIRLQDAYDAPNCSPELFRCTLTKVPETKSLLDKSRLPLGVLIHPFKDLNQLSVIQCSDIVRCRSCRTYINPFVYFVDAKHWKCNICFRVNELPDEFQYDPLTKTYGDPSRRPEIKSATIEFIAPSEYMVRPPQPAAYVFVMEVSRAACESGYLQVLCDTLLDQLEALPGDARTSLAFITFDSSVHYYSLAENHSQPHQMVVLDVDDMFVPSPDNLLVNLNECLFLVKDLLKDLPNRFAESFDTGSSLGAALQAAYKLLAATGGRVSVFLSSLAGVGPGKLIAREDPCQRSGDNLTQSLLNPSIDLYKKYALDCSGQQIAVDLFILNSQFIDLATISGISRFSGGCMHHFPMFNLKNAHMVEMFHRTLHRYLCRKIGFESVMRLRCTRGLSIHTFHGNLFVRSIDLLSLPNINPDAGFGMQVSIDENLTDIRNVCFQAALLYTSSKGERRIRVHTLCLPVASNLSDILHGADQQCIIGLLSKMAVDRCHQSSLSDAREAFVNVVSDVLSVYKVTQSNTGLSSLMVPLNLSLLPLYILALLKHAAFRVGQSTRLDDRVFAMCQMKTLPLSQLMLSIYPDLYPIHNITEYPEVSVGDRGLVVQPPRLHLSSESIESTGLYLLDDGDSLIVYVGHNLPPHLAKAFFDVPSFAAIDPHMVDLPEVKSPESERLHSFISYLQNDKPVSLVVQIIRNDSQLRQKFLDKLVEDKNESGHSYYEFLQNIKVCVK